MDRSRQILDGAVKFQIGYINRVVPTQRAWDDPPMVIFPPVRKKWTGSRLRKFVPDADLVRQVCDANGVAEIPPGLRHLVGEKA
ncbi:hypothetical protein GCM10022281_14670 [Sphingomonas rosea]|uniref:Uncharacterized protein n=1 Tax=Sphingomonas rosea TaxID=335605 RepID=A0ABP7U406_9SPHN